MKLGTGVVSLPVPQPALGSRPRAVPDRLLRGRFMLGLGPGALPDRRHHDRHQPGGAAPAFEERRRRPDGDLCAGRRSPRRPAGTTWSMRRRSSRPTATSTSWSPRSPARQVRAWPPPRTASTCCRSAPRAKGGFDALALHWDVMEQRAPEYGHTPDRGKWRLCGPMHLAETKEQAIEDVRYGLDAWCDYTQDVLAAPHFRAAGKTFEERVAWVNETGLGVIGTPDEADRPDRAAGEAVRRLRLLPADPPRVGPSRRRRCAATSCSPTTSSRRFQGSTSRLEQASDYAGPGGPSSTSARATPSQAATDRHAKERAAAD